MRFKSMLAEVSRAGGLPRELALALLTLGLGFGLMPLLIYLVGAWTLGKYEGASATRVYQGVYQGLSTGSEACWIVVLGPYGLYLIFKTLRLCWRASAGIA